MKKLYKIQILFIILLSYQVQILAQESPKLITINKKVGEVIDQEEKKSYDLFDEYSDEVFKEAKFFRNSDKSSFLIIYLTDGTEKKHDLSPTEFFTYKKRIDKRKIEYDKIAPSDMCIIKLFDESSVSGKIIKKSDRNIIVNTKYLGDISIQKKNISDVIVLDSKGKANKKFWLPNPHDSRHLFAPTARNLPKGEGYFQDIYLLLLNVNYGITDYLTVGGGMSIVPGLGIDQQVYLLNAKFGFEITERLSLGGGLLYGNIPLGDEVERLEELTVPIWNSSPPRDTTISISHYDFIPRRSNVGLGFGLATYGSRENNVTFGMGYVYMDDDSISIQKPIFMLGGMARISRRMAFVTENWLFFQENDAVGKYACPIISYGIRFFGEKMSVDLAFLQAPGEHWIDLLIFPGIPYVDFVIKF